MTEYIYRVAEIVNVVDGDTYDLRVEKAEPYDFGFHVKINPSALIRVRLNGYDCPEARKGSEHERHSAKEAKEAAFQWLTLRAGRLSIETEPDPDDFGRWLGTITNNNDGQSLGDCLASLDLATRWPIRWRETYDRG